MYADIGPSSRTTRLPVSTHFLDDNHVEYAHLNYQNDAKKTETVEVHSVGKFHQIVHDHHTTI